MKIMKIQMTDFVSSTTNPRHFNNPNFAGTKIDGSPEEFSARLDQIVSQLQASETDLVEGYAPFCKHLFLENFTGCLSGVAAITKDNKNLLDSDYNARREEELPVLSRFFHRKDVGDVKAAFLDIVLYSEEQCAAEDIKNSEDGIISGWGIVSINAEMTPAESPMTPITMLRNALGKDEGGSGVALDREKFLAAVTYWTKFATIR